MPREFGRVIFHVDMDSFYASCELSNRPELRNVPFVVGADPKDGKGRGVVLACNYPARKFGLHSGMPISRAWQLCPQAHYDFPHFDLYEQVSSRVMKIIQTLADKVEQISIDEAFLEVTDRIATIIENDRVSSELSAIQSLADSIRKNISDKEIDPEPVESCFASIHGFQNSPVEPDSTNEQADCSQKYSEDYVRQ